MKKEIIKGGLVPHIDPNEAQLEEVFGTIKIKEPKPIDWRPQLENENQGSWPFCVLFSSSNIQQWNEKQEKVKVNLAPRFLASRSKMSRTGTTFQKALTVLRKEGCGEEKDCPMDKSLSWAKMLNTSFLTKEQLENALKYRIKGYARVDSRKIKKQQVQQLLQESPLLLGIGIGDTYRNKIIKQPRKYKYYHAVDLAGFDKDNNWLIKDSNPPYDKVLDKNYSLIYLYKLIDLPDDWKKKQEESKKKDYSIALAHYGKPRNYWKEVEIAYELYQAFKKIKDAQVGSTAGRLFTVLINAVSYGEYTITDMKNHCWNYTFQKFPIFDLNKVKGSEGFRLDGK